MGKRPRVHLVRTLRARRVAVRFCSQTGTTLAGTSDARTAGHCYDSESQRAVPGDAKVIHRVERLLGREAGQCKLSGGRELPDITTEVQLLEGGPAAFAASQEAVRAQRYVILVISTFALAARKHTS